MSNSIASLEEEKREFILRVPPSTVVLGMKLRMLKKDLLNNFLVALIDSQMYFSVTFYSII